MNEFLVRTSDIPELEKHGVKVTYVFKFLDLVSVETQLSWQELSKVKGVYNVELNDVFGTFNAI